MSVIIDNTNITNNVITTTGTPNNNLFNDCTMSTLESGGDNNLAMLYCISTVYDSIQQQVLVTTPYSTRNWLMIYCATLILFMQAGFAMLVGGCVRKKNLQNTMSKNLLDVCGASIAFWSIGYAFAYGGENNDTSTSIEGITFVGTTNFFTIGLQDTAFWFFQFAFCATSVTIVAGTLAERCQMSAYLYYSLFVTGFVYPVLAHAIWSIHGKLSISTPINIRFRSVGVIDFAGSGVVHLLGGTIALIAAYILGPRVGRFYNSDGILLDKPKEIIGHSIPLQVLGTLILWFGWYGFNPGSALLLTDAISTSVVASRAACNTTLSGACGGLTSMIVHLIKHYKETGEINYNLTMTMNGLLSGLVAITAGAATVEMWSSILIGIIAGILYVYGSQFLLYCHIDDAVDAIPVHMFNGAWGLLSTGLFTSRNGMYNAFGDSNPILNNIGWFYNMSNPTLLINQCIGIIIISFWAIITMMPFFTLLNYYGLFRSDGIEEVVGLDIRYNSGGNLEIDEQELKNDLEQYKDLLLNSQQQQKQNNNNNNNTSTIHQSNHSNGTTNANSTGSPISTAGTNMNLLATNASNLTKSLLKKEKK